MPPLIVHGASLACSLGAVPSVLTVLPKPAAAQAPALFLATVADTIPLTNVATFGQRMSLKNPAVQAATTAASGVITPAPRVPAANAPWTPGSTAVSVRAQPAVAQTASCLCRRTGVVSVVASGQAVVEAV
jgi:Domain of unknown function (DUF4280)